MSEDVHARVARWVQLLLLLGPYTTDTLSDKEEPATTGRHRKFLKSGELRTAGTQVMRKVEWAHELVYMVEGKPAEYDTLSISLFISEYTKIMVKQKPDTKSQMRAHLAELMTDSGLYRWEAVRAFHAVYSFNS